ncbi:hypothetical protein ACHAXA_004113 [Cyclostephanos tholiformis]|uniref:Uncharacterized protein n=1 Tax=Cyclostephanos tholiformis TaxID=382380 RepID=A0ABD3SHE3_9STRA
MEEVDFGFTPQNYYADSVGFSLWSYAAPDGRCLTYAEARQSVIFSSDGGGRNVYSNFFISNDTSWTISRMLAVVGPVFGNFALISAWANIFKHEPCLVDILAYTTIIASMSECSKFGLFLVNDLCNSPDYWHNVESDDYYASEGCSLDRGAIMSIFSMLSYITSMILTVGFAARPQNDGVKLESASLASWMASEPGSSKAQAPPVPEYSRTMDHQSSINGYAWSRSAPSSIPSIPENESENMEQTPQNAPMMRASSRQHYPPPTNNVPRRYDDTSTLTWDPGY